MTTHFKLLQEKLEDKGIDFGMYLMQKGFQVWCHSPLHPWMSEYYKNHNENLIEKCLIEVDFMRHYDKIKRRELFIVKR